MEKISIINTSEFTKNIVIGDSNENRSFEFYTPTLTDSIPYGTVLVKFEKIKDVEGYDNVRFLTTPFGEKEYLVVFTRPTLNTIPIYIYYVNSKLKVSNRLEEKSIYHKLPVFYVLPSPDFSFHLNEYGICTPTPSLFLDTDISDCVKNQKPISILERLKKSNFWIIIILIILIIIFFKNF
jgi:hypothetical protein